MAKSVGAYVDGLKAVQKKMEALGVDGTRAFYGALYAEALHIMDRSADKTPVVTSRLRNSQFVTVPRSGAKLRNIRFGYGVKYAYRVHEGITSRVKDLPRDAQKAFWAGVDPAGANVTWKKSTTGGPKFLEHAVDETRSGRVQRIAKTAWRYYLAKLGPQPDGGMPRSEAGGRAKAKSRAEGVSS